MWRCLLGALIGLLSGVGLAVGLLWISFQVLKWQTAPLVFQMEHGVIYQSLILGAGFGALCGTVIATATGRHESAGR